MTDGATTVTRIVSGGQTGVDRAALDVAMELGLEHGGWCPRGRLAEDGTIPTSYRLEEMQTADYRDRTEQNVIDSDGTLILYRATLQGGTRLTHQLALRYDKPVVLVDLQQVLSVSFVGQWLLDNNIQTLNVAGPRESGAPGIHDQARTFLISLLASPNETTERF